MPDTSTEVAIASQTLGSAAASITFSSIPATYTDLRLVLVGTVTAASSLRLTFNSDSASNYSTTDIAAGGSNASLFSNRTTNRNFLTFHNDNLSTTIPQFYSIDTFSYTGSTNKTVLATTSQDMNGSGSVVVTVGLWRNTSAINTATLTNSTSTFAAGTTATLYGIL